MIRLSPELKANELTDLFLPTSRDWDVKHYALFNAKHNSLLCVNEQIELLTKLNTKESLDLVNYYQEVIEELHQL